MRRLTLLPTLRLFAILATGLLILWLCLMSIWTVTVSEESIDTLRAQAEQYVLRLGYHASYLITQGEELGGRWALGAQFTQAFRVDYDRPEQSSPLLFGALRLDYGQQPLGAAQARETRIPVAPPSTDDLAWVETAYAGLAENALYPDLWYSGKYDGADDFLYEDGLLGHSPVHRIQLWYRTTVSLDDGGPATLTVYLEGRPTEYVWEQLTPIWVSTFCLALVLALLSTLWLTRRLPRLFPQA